MAQSFKVKNGLCVTVSQSGKSPDIVALQDAARKAGALTVALVNVEDSPAAHAADICLPLHAGPELSVAATKSFIVSLVAGAAIVAHWLDRKDCLPQSQRLPEQLATAASIDWPEAVDLAKGAESLYVLARGPSLPIAAETALKLKETCAIHAEAYSIAEVMHGPLELLGEGFPVLAYSPEDGARPVLARVAGQDAPDRCQCAGGRGGRACPLCGPAMPCLIPISMIQTAYRFVEATAVARGRDPDRPRLLKKVTETV